MGDETKYMHFFSDVDMSTRFSMLFRSHLTLFRGFEVSTAEGQRRRDLDALEALRFDAISRRRPRGAPTLLKTRFDALRRSSRTLSKRFDALQDTLRSDLDSSSLTLFKDALEARFDAI